MKINRNILTRMIQESIKKNLLKEWGDTWNYPGDADFWSNAPWYDREPETDTTSETYLTIPFILRFVSVSCQEYEIENANEILEELKQTLVGCPEQVEVDADYEFEYDAEEDEDGWHSFRTNEKCTNLCVYIIIGKHFEPLMNWLKSKYEQSNPELYKILVDAYDHLKWELEDYSSTASDFEDKLYELSKEVQSFM